jgi:hypothetical protein
LKRVANSTFLYASYLNYDPLAEVIGVGRPGLILSCDPLHLLGPGCPYVVNFLPSHAFLRIWHHDSRMNYSQQLRITAFLAIL